MKKGIVLFAIVAMAACVPLSPQSESGPGKDFQDACASLQEKKYDTALAGYQKIMHDAPDTELAADARFEVALIHATPDNPQKNYTQAIQLFEEFIKLHPENRKVLDARAWILVLRNVLDLKKENEALKKNIEELKLLDIRHEERRRK